MLSYTALVHWSQCIRGTHHERQPLTVDEYDYIVVNQNVDEAFAEVQSILKAERLKRVRVFYYLDTTLVLSRHEIHSLLPWINTTLRSTTLRCATTPLKHLHNHLHGVSLWSTSSALLS